MFGQRGGRIAEEFLAERIVGTEAVQQFVQLFGCRDALAHVPSPFAWWIR